MSESPSLPVVEIHPAWVFTCEDCGRDTFVRSTVYDAKAVDLDEQFDPEDAEAIREHIADGSDGQFLTAPDRVKCSHCGAAFEAVEPP